MTELQKMNLRKYLNQWKHDCRVYWEDLPGEWRRALANRKWYTDGRGEHTYLHAHALQFHTKGVNIDADICTSRLIDFKLWMELRHPHVTVEDVGYFPRYMDEALSFM